MQQVRLLCLLLRCEAFAYNKSLFSLLWISSIQACLGIFFSLFVNALVFFDRPDAKGSLLTEVRALVLSVLVDGVLSITWQAIEAAKAIVRRVDLPVSEEHDIRQ